MISAKKIIKKLGLKPLPPEGGFFRETYRSVEKIPKIGLPARYTSDKSFGTAIYYLLTSDNFSALHRLSTDEIYHFYLGDPVTMLSLYPDGKGRLITLGHDIEHNQCLQVVVPKGVWQGSFLKQGRQFALMGTTMAPGYDSTDYEAGIRDVLINQYPKHRELITKLTL